MYRSRSSWALLVTLLIASPSVAQDKKYSIKLQPAEPPPEIQEPIRKLLSTESIQFFDHSGKLICEVWPGKELKFDATPEQIKNGLTYRELKETQVVGAIRFKEPWHDYRTQKIRPGVYTLRLGLQPQDGDHAGKSQFTEFVLLSAAVHDAKPDTMTHKNLVDMSMKSIDSGHPAVLMLFPNEKPGKTWIESRPRDHWVVNFACGVKTANGSGLLGFGLTPVGEADD
jgi:hypothetical protein